MTVICAMQLQNYPLDSQWCELRVLSCKYLHKKVRALILSGLSSPPNDWLLYAFKTPTTWTS